MTSPFETSRSFGGIPLISGDASPLDDEAIEQVEEATGPLPKDYRLFLTTCNGGRPADAFLEFRGSKLKKDRVTITSLSRINSESLPHLWDVDHQGNSYTFMTIAESHSDPITLRLDPGGLGQIYFIRNLTPYDYFKPNVESNPELLKTNPEHYSLTLIAESFTKFTSCLHRITNDSIPSREELSPSVESYCMYGDHFFEEATVFLDQLSTEELNESWPKDAEYPHLPLYIAANYSQVHIAKYLIDRGVDIHHAVSHCYDCFEVSRMMIHSGATLQDLRDLLVKAAFGISCTKRPQEPYLIIKYVLDLGVSPDFSDPNEIERWSVVINGTFTKKILCYLASAIDFPEELKAEVLEQMKRTR